MDKALALQMLGLGPDATRADAKKAFRQMAKTCHPDRFARSAQEEARAERQMKALNAVMAFLLPLLPETPGLSGPAIGPKQQARSRTDFFSAFWQGLTSPRRKAPGPSQGSRSPRPAAKPAQECPRPGGTPAPERARPVFDHLLKKAGSQPPMPPVKRFPAQDAYARYLKYKSQTRRQKRGMSVSQVEAISPVTRVTPVDGS